MEKLKAIFAYAFTVDFLLKILLITVISTIWGGGFTIRVSDIEIANKWGGFEIKLKEPVTIKLEEPLAIKAEIEPKRPFNIDEYLSR